VRKKRSKAALSRFKPQSEWKEGCSVLQGRREGVGRLLYHGKSTIGGSKFRLILNGKGPGTTRIVSDVTVSKAYDELCEMHRLWKFGPKPTVAASYTLADLATEYFDHRMEAAVRIGYRPSPRWVSLEQQRIGSYILTEFGACRLQSMDSGTGEKIVERLRAHIGTVGAGLSQKTKSGTWHSFMAMLGWAVRTGRLACLPFNGDIAMKRLANAPGDVYRRHAERKARGWDNEGLQAFWHARDLSLQIDRMASLAVLNGPRPGELCLIRIADVDLTRGTLCIDKSANDVRLRNCKALQDNPHLIKEWQDRHDGAGHVPGAPKTLQSLRTIHLDTESMEIICIQLSHVGELYRSGLIDSDQAQYLFPNTHNPGSCRRDVIG
jgi:integrase